MTVGHGGQDGQGVGIQVKVGQVGHSGQLSLVVVSHWGHSLVLSSGHDVVVGHGGQEVVAGQVILGHGVDVGHEGHGIVTLTTSGVGQTSTKRSCQYTEVHLGGGLSHWSTASLTTYP